MGLFWLAAGVAIGWLVPQPLWFKGLMVKLKEKIRKENP